MVLVTKGHRNKQSSSETYLLKIEHFSKQNMPKHR